LTPPLGRGDPLEFLLKLTPEKLDGWDYRPYGENLIA